MKDKIFGVLQRVGRSFMLPIALLPIAGLLLGIGSSFTNPTTLEAYHLTNVIKEGGVLFTLLDIMSKTGSRIKTRRTNLTYIVWSPYVRIFRGRSGSYLICQKVQEDIKFTLKGE